jgi:hypothetical protein
MQPRIDDLDGPQKDGHFQNYSDYSRTLRAWFVAYGIGGPVIFLTNDTVAKRVASSGHANQIIVYFLLGVALQIVLALINKWCAWYMYRGAGDAKYQACWRYRLWAFINSQSWIDFWIDFVSLIAFMVATWRVLHVFLLPGQVT